MTISLDKSARKPLGDQLATELKCRISKGDFLPGDVLPSISDLAQLAKVSAKVSRQALSRLSDEGWVIPRRGVGSVVCSRDDDADCQGRVLMYVRDTGFSYYSSHLCMAVTDNLRKAGYRLTITSASAKNDKMGCRHLKEQLRYSWNLVIEFGYSAMSRDLIESAHMPFVILGDGSRVPDSKSTMAVGKIDILCGKAIPDLLRAIASTDTNRVVQFSYGGGAFDISDRLSGMQVRFDRLVIPPQTSPEDVSRTALREMDRFVRKGGLSPRTLLLFTDDYIAQGALLSILAHGLRIPEDLRVVSHANKGQGPVWLTPLTRLEMDPSAHGKMIAKAILAYLSTGKPLQDIVFGSEWVWGQTFVKGYC